MVYERSIKKGTRFPKRWSDKLLKKKGEKPMLIKEVRNIIDKYSEKELKVLIAEIYKAIPKKIKEEKDIDELIQDINFRKKSRRRTVSSKEEIDINYLEYEVNQFIEYAYKQYYFAPNSYVYKKERSKWRFEAKRFIKDLEMVSGNHEDIEIATNLMRGIYEVLCYGTYYVIFSSSEPFNSVGIEQEDLYEKIISRLFISGVNTKNIQEAIKIMVANEPSSDLIPVLLENLKTTEAKQIAIEQSELLLKRIKNKEYLTDNLLERKLEDNYWLDDKINIIVELVFDCYISLRENKSACMFLKKHYQAIDDEVKLYVLLRLIEEKELVDLWINEYEKAVEKGIEVRKELQKKYVYISENNKVSP